MCVAGASLTPAISQANGRYPAAQYFALGEGDAAQRMAIVTTFGLVLSTDGGRTWHWSCEEALDYSGQFDPTVAITSNGSLVVGLPDGVSVAQTDWCGFARPAGFVREPVADLSSAGGVVVAMTTPSLGEQAIYRSDNHGMDWRRMWGRAEFYSHTVDVAPSDTQRVYATAWLRGARPALFRSDNGGSVMNEISSDFAGGYIAYLAWIDPLSADSLLIRADLDPMGTQLLRSTNGGRALTRILSAGSPLIAVTAAPGGTRIWASSTNLGERIQRTVDGGASWASVQSTLRPRSMRFARERLYATANEQDNGFSFACSRDDGESFRPVFSLTELLGPEACPEGSPVRTICTPLWPAVRDRLAMIRGPSAPAGAPCESAEGDGGIVSEDAANTQRDVPLDVAHEATGRLDAARDASEPRVIAGGGCACHAAGMAPNRANSPNGWIGLGLGALVAVYLRKRKGTTTALTLTGSSIRMVRPRMRILLDSAQTTQSGQSSRRDAGSDEGIRRFVCTSS